MTKVESTTTPFLETRITNSVVNDEDGQQGDYAGGSDKISSKTAW
ncbi:hypothetical protein [Echinicola strongylocentroti]|nr:hypothetical protein [Echinicola strongylocentroti]